MLEFRIAKKGLPNLGRVARLATTNFHRLAMHTLLHDLVVWEPLPNPEPGYTVIVGCMKNLAAVVIANLRLCARMNKNRLHEIILVFDCSVDQIPSDVRDLIAESNESLRIRVVGYNDRERRVSQFLNWSWVYCWLSWCIAFREARSQAVIIHDLDALPLDSQLFERIYDNFLESEAHFCGISHYTNPRCRIDTDLNVVSTYEMAFDLCHVRQHFMPIDLFNKTRWANGRIVDFDTMLYTQWKSTRRVVRTIDETALVHPSQMVCNYTDLLAGRSKFRDRDHSLPILPYFLHLGGAPTLLLDVTPEIDSIDCRSIVLANHECWINGIPPNGWAWMEKQIRRVEQRLFDHTRPEVEAYLSGFIKRAREFRTVGMEVGPTRVAAK